MMPKPAQRASRCAPSLRRLFLVDNLDLDAATGVEGARWEAFQLRHLDDEGTFRIENKARQIAWSWLTAAEAVAVAMLSGESSMFVSINLDEATEKIRYARAVYDGLRVSGLPKITRDNRLALEFSNDSRLISLPAKPPRGRSRFNVYLDEFAHVRDARDIYTAALPVISKGGRLRIGSSPYGASGVFWEVFTEHGRRYPGYVRRSTPWWRVAAFCTNVRAASSEAPALSVAERVERYGNERIRQISDNMLIEDFSQEYDCQFVDETTAWIPWEEIRAIEEPEHVWEHAAVSGAEIGGAFEAIDRLRALIDRRVVEGAFTGGYDVGRKRDASELALVGLATTQSYPLRLAVTLDRTPYDEQADVLHYALSNLPIVKLQIDRNGIGGNLAENTEKRFPGKAVGVDFTNASKTLWATDTKMLVQQRKARLPVDREWARQIHSIKRQVSVNATTFDAERTERSHADKFWAWALALNGALALGRTEDDEVKVRSRRR